eukprot:gene44203-39008_t
MRVEMMTVARTQALLPLMLGRFAVSWALSLTAVATARGCGMGLHPLGPPPTRRLLVVRGALYWALVASWWVAVRRIPLGDVTAAALAWAARVTRAAHCARGAPPRAVEHIAAACAVGLTVGAIAVRPPHEWVVPAFAALCLQTAGFQLADATAAAMMWYVQVPFAYAL